MGNVGQRLQDVVGHGEQEVGGEQPAQAEDAVAHRQGNGEESEKVETEEFQQVEEKTSQFVITWKFVSVSLFWPRNNSTTTAVKLLCHPDPEKLLNVFLSTHVRTDTSSLK